MTAFKEQIALDNTAVFLNMDEFADNHDLDGLLCKCIIQNITSDDALSMDKKGDWYPGIFGNHVMINVAKDDVRNVPEPGEPFYLDNVPHLVESVSDDIGILTIILVENAR